MNTYGAWWEDNLRGKPNYSEKDLSKRHFITNLTWTSYPGLRRNKPATNHLRHNPDIKSKINLAKT